MTSESEGSEKKVASTVWKGVVRKSKKGNTTVQYAEVVMSHESVHSLGARVSRVFT